MPSEVYGLSMFYDYNKVVITRGRTMEEAYKRACQNWQRGETICIANALPIDAAKRYSENHAEGWLYRKPEWLKKEEAD